MEEYREAQREKWLRAQQEKQSQAPGPGASVAAASDPDAEPAADEGAPSSTAASSSAAPTTGAASSGAGAEATGRKPNARRVHILPVGRSPDSSDKRRLEILAPELKHKRATEEVIKTGLIIRSSDHEFIVVKSEPDECLLSSETDYFVQGDPIARFEKVQFICLRDFETVNTGQDPSVLFNDYISPHFRHARESGEDVGNIVVVGDIVKILDLEFRVMAADPSPPDIGIIDSETMVFVDWDSTPEFDKIHIVPFQDTLPHAYEFDVFNDYLKPYLTRNKHMRLGVNDQFTYQGVQFKVVCTEPNGPARIGRNTTIYCEGVLHPSLRNLLPPELLEQLSHLPPGLQMLLLNTEALAGGYEERLIEVQEMLSRRRGLSSETIDRVDKFRWQDIRHEHAQTQCMVCLSDFADADEVRPLPCGHVFHAPCIDEWLRRCTDCPICKANVDRAVRHY
mmetsp:Transcript_27196/g.84638  ORF Transcript_27196/g.84638 Transcript_27196/m.84638 type:complete len:452 (-) Transcript_27196:114-1469(-)